MDFFKPLLKFVAELGLYWGWLTVITVVGTPIFHEVWDVSPNLMVEAEDFGSGLCSQIRETLSASMSEKKIVSLEACVTWRTRTAWTARSTT